jgi:hypothetical protein
MVIRTEPGGKSPVETVLALLPDHRKSGKGWTARCPAHEDGRASLSVGVGKDGQVLLRCHAGCDFKDIVKALKLEERDLFATADGDHAGNGRERPGKDWGALARQYAAQLTPEVKKKAAAHLGLPPAALDLLPHVGYSPKPLHKDKAGPCLTFPEADGSGRVCGILGRYRDGSKLALAGGRRGLIVPGDWKGSFGPVLVVEGPSDTLALSAMGLCAVGRPSNSTGAEDLATLLQGLPPGRDVIVLGEHDSKADLKFPGLEGLLTVWGELKRRLPGRDVYGVMPPRGHKDVRAWFTAQKPALGDQGQLLGLGKTFLAAVEKAKQKDPPGWLGGAPKPTAGTNGHATEPWEPPGPLGVEYEVPPFPVDVLPESLAGWVEAEAVATQTPPDLAALLALAVCAAGVAGKVRVEVRPGWTEPLNLFTVTALFVGERKSVVFRDALAPVKDYERRRREREAPAIAEKAAEHRVLEKRLKVTEERAAKANDPAERDRLKGEARQLARDLAAHEVPAEPQFWCDDETPESLAKLLAEQGGRMLQASDEGTAFEIAKGRYSDQGRPNFEVYLKGHSGDSLRVGRVGRDGATVDRPALSMALAVQPDVICGLAEHASMRGRGLLARFLYAVPESLLGRRQVKPAPVLRSTTNAYHATVSTLWDLPGTVDEQGEPAPRWLKFSPGADAALEGFERWLEPQLAPGGKFSHLGGWPNKLAGAVARVAAVLHLAEHAGTWDGTIDAATVTKAVRLGKDYLLPHALAAFGLMGADEKLVDARAVLDGLLSNCVHCVHSVQGVETYSKRDIHYAFRGRFKTAEALDPVLKLLEDAGYLRLIPQEKKPGVGRKASPRYEVNPLAQGARTRTDPPEHNEHNEHNCREPGQEG